MIDTLTRKRRLRIVTCAAFAAAVFAIAPSTATAEEKGCNTTQPYCADTCNWGNECPQTQGDCHLISGANMGCPASVCDIYATAVNLIHCTYSY